MLAIAATVRLGAVGILASGARTKSALRTVVRSFGNCSSSDVHFVGVGLLYRCDAANQECHRCGSNPDGTPLALGGSSCSPPRRLRVSG